MNANALLALIGDLYSQIAKLTDDVARLTAEKEQLGEMLNQAVPTAAATPRTGDD